MLGGAQFRHTNASVWSLLLCHRRGRGFMYVGVSEFDQSLGGRGLCGTAFLVEFQRVGLAMGEGPNARRVSKAQLLTLTPCDFC